MDACSQNDFVVGKAAWVLWGVPLAGVLLGVLAGGAARAVLWTLGFLVMGISCVVNARRCGRLHCFITGPPLYLLAAVATVAAAPWGWIAFTVVVGTIAAYALEFGCGKYRHNSSRPLQPVRSRTDRTWGSPVESAQPDEAQGLLVSCSLPRGDRQGRG